MRYEVRAGWQKPVWTFKTEQGAVGVWERVYRNADAGFWTIDDAGLRQGTREGGPRLDFGGLYLHACVECQHDFYVTVAGNEPLCPGCLLMVRPGELPVSPDEALEEWKHGRERKWLRRTRLHGSELPPRTDD